MALKEELREEARKIAAKMHESPTATVIQIARRWRHSRVSLQATAQKLESSKDELDWKAYLSCHREKQFQDWRLALAVSMIEAPAPVTPPGPVGRERGAPEGGG